mgnify:CR=1 FL=1
MGKLEDARKELARSAISSKILLELYSEGVTRSSALVNKIAGELRCSSTLVYDSLDELVRNGLIHSPTARKRLKFYALTEDGKSLINEEILKKEIEIKGVKKQVPEPTKEVALDLLTEEIFRELPSQYRTFSTRMLVRRNLDEEIDSVKERVLKRLKKET